MTSLSPSSLISPSMLLFIDAMTEVLGLMPAATDTLAV